MSPQSLPTSLSLVVRWLLLGLVTAFVPCCHVAPIDLPVATSWRTYENAQLGVALELPDFFSVKEYEGGAIFRIQGTNAVLLRFVDRDEAKRRGLWVGSAPAGAITLGGRPGLRYVYEHGDGPVASVTEAYVIPYRGKELGLEFRTRNDAAVRERMLGSLRILDGVTTRGAR
jgi:hypothetical protein